MTGAERVRRHRERHRSDRRTDTAATQVKVDALKARVRQLEIELAAAEADPEITGLSMSAQQKFDSAIRRHKKKLDDQNEGYVRSEIRRLLDELSIPRLIEREKDASRIINARNKGVFTTDQYNKILRCLHRDLTPDVEQKNGAVQLWYAAKLLLLSNKDDPRTYPSALPTLDELRARAAAGVAKRKKTRP